MYIISKRKDYYDGVAGTFGIDKTIVYKRETEEISSNSKNFPEEFDRQNKNSLVRIMPKYNAKENSKYVVIDNIIIGFCGKLYTGWLAVEQKNKQYQ